MKCYFHASLNPIKVKELPPSSFYEKLDKNGNVIMQFIGMGGPPIVPVSDVQETAFAKSPGGAVLGSYSSTRKTGSYHVYKTCEKPDFDLSDEISDWHDFDVTGEVRYRRPVPISFVCRVPVTARDAKKLDFAYSPEFEGSTEEYPPIKPRLVTFRRQFTRLCKGGS